MENPASWNDTIKLIAKVIDAPVRLCCGERHWGAVCPDGKVMCQLCFERFEIKDLHKVDGIPEDVCIRCSENEKA